MAVTILETPHHNIRLDEPAKILPNEIRVSIDGTVFVGASPTAYWEVDGNGSYSETVVRIQCISWTEM